MEITVYQIHNVLRTYHHLIKAKPPPELHEPAAIDDPDAPSPSTYDPVTLSEESIQRAKAAQEKAEKPGA